MKKIYSMEQVRKFNYCSKELIDSMIKIIEILDSNYGKERDIDNDLGGYIVVVENIVDIEMLKQGKLKGLVAEYTDIIECSEGVNWTSSLFLLSSDFSIVVITTEELSNFLLK